MIPRLAGADTPVVTDDVADEAARRGRHERDDRGIAVVWLGLTLLVLMAFAGFGVDISHWWLEAQREQRAADAAAHAGVVHLPGDLAGATLTARREAAKNGFNDGIDGSSPVNATIVVTQEPNPNRLRVKITRDVPSFFTRLIGLDSEDIVREAVAEFVAPIPMGSPENKMGNDPENNYDDTQLWVNVAGPNATKISGDRFSAKVCPTSVAGCTGTAVPGSNNDEYAPEGYFFSADVKNGVAGEPLRFDVYDAVMAYTGDYCEQNMPSASQRLTLQTWYPDAYQRYEPGSSTASSRWCPGDQNINGNAATKTTFIVREPDDTPWNDEDNPVVNVPGCAPLTIDARVPTSSSSIYQWLHPADGIADAEAVMNPDDGQLTFAEMFHRFATICEIPPSNVRLGQYVLQVRTNAGPGFTTYDASRAEGGHNRMSIRVGFGQAGVDVASGADVALYARGRLPIYANATAADTTFYLARINPYDAGRVLRINLFDMGDAAQAGTLQILPPTEYAPSIGGCSFSRDNGGALTVNSGTCTMSDVSSGNGFNGRVVTVDVPIPADYTCADASPSGCWFRVRAAFPAGVSDTTTWTAAIIGNPVRLVE